MLEEESLGNHISSVIMINCLNEVVEMIPDDEIRRTMESAIVDCEEILERQEKQQGKK